MDFPIFHLDFLNNRFLIAIIAVLHVLINHPMAVGGLPVVTLIEWMGQKDKKESEKWDRLSYKILFVFFIITTTIGAMTGVGIWFSVSLVNPYSIGSLIRVFYWGWFTEWIVFVTEVSLILFYFLTWKKLSKENKKKHIKVGVILSIASWVTMAIIVAILGFMMDPGNWLSDRSFISGVLNPIYIPQLMFRTPLAMIMGGALSLFLSGIFVKNDRVFFTKVKILIGKWTIAWIPLFLLGSYAYYKAVPEFMRKSIGVANLTQDFMVWHESFVWMIGIIVIFVVIVGAINGYTRFVVPKLVNFFVFISLGFGLSHFERVREFIRKPYVIGKYMYANGFRVDDYPLLQKEGILKNAAYSRVRNITKENELIAGKEVFKIACTRCHTINGTNSIRNNIKKMYGDGEWSASSLDSYMENMHEARVYMPPFPGNAEERMALAKYLVHLKDHDDYLYGDQEVGIELDLEGVSQNE